MKHLLERARFVPRVVALVGLLALAAARAPRPEGGAGVELESARKRFASLTNAERTELRARFERFKSLTPAEQEALRRRARNLQRLDEEVVGSLPPELSEQLAAMPPAKQRELRRDLLRSEAHERGWRLRELLQPVELEELQSTPGARERAAYLHEFKQRSVERIVAAMLERIARQGGVAAELVREIRALPREERLRELLAWNARLTEDDVVRYGLPFRIRPEQWASWRDLPPEDFFAEVARHRERLLADRERIRARDPRTTTVIDPRRRAGLRALLAAVRHEPKRDILELAALDQQSRRARVAALRRTRCLGVLREFALVDEAEWTHLSYLPEEEFLYATRRLLAPVLDGPERDD